MTTDFVFLCNILSKVEIMEIIITCCCPNFEPNRSGSYWILFYQNDIVLMDGNTEAQKLSRIGPSWCLDGRIL